MALFRSTGDLWGEALVLLGEGDLEFLQQNYDQAKVAFERSLKIFEQFGDKWGVFAALNGLGEVDLKQRDYITVRSRFQTVLTISWDSGAKEGIANALAGISAAFRAQGQLRSAATLGGAAEALYESIGTRIQSLGQANHNSNLADLRKAIHKNQFATFWAEGRAMTMEQAIQHAFVILNEDQDTLNQTMQAQYAGQMPREREIVLLIAQGKSNRAIAEELVISEKTAERHVANILFKQGFHSRTQIATWAVEKGASR